MSGLGNALRKQLSTRKHRVAHGGGVFSFVITISICSFSKTLLQRHTVDLHDSVDDRQDRIRSIMERNAIDEFLVSSQLAGRTVYNFSLLF